MRSRFIPLCLIRCNLPGLFLVVAFFPFQISLFQKSMVCFSFDWIESSRAAGIKKKANYVEKDYCEKAILKLCFLFVVLVRLSS